MITPRGHVCMACGRKASAWQGKVEVHGGASGTGRRLPVWGTHPFKAPCLKRTGCLATAKTQRHSMGLNLQAVKPDLEAIVAFCSG